jgi:hypothetical protein
VNCRHAGTYPPQLSTCPEDPAHFSPVSGDIRRDTGRVLRALVRIQDFSDWIQDFHRADARLSAHKEAVMTGIEKRQFDMLVRVRNFGDTHHALFVSSPAAQQAFAAIVGVVDDVSSHAMKKTAAAANARSGRRAAARRELRALLRKACRLARTLRDDGRPVPSLALPATKNDVTAMTTGRYFAKEIAPFEEEFGSHGLGSARIAAATAAFKAAITQQNINRNDFIIAKTHIPERLRAGIRAARRLDLIVEDEHERDPVLSAQWKEARRLDSRRTRVSASANPPADAAAA